MYKHYNRVVACLLSILLGMVIAVDAVAGTPTAVVPNAPLATEIIVTTSQDINTSKSETCVSHTPCTLRRAIVQARALSAGDRPILISFDIPTSDSGYDAVNDVWELNINTTTDPSVFRTLEGGQITIDGTTQPGGRITGPKIILIGPGTGSKDGLIIGANAAGGHDGNTIRGLAFQNFKTHVTVNSKNNLLEDNWFGLTTDGTMAYLRNDNPQDGSGSAGIALTAGANDNIIQDNYFLGFDGVAAAIRAENNLFTGNMVGMKADGTVPKPSEASLLCSLVDWLGGGGVSVEGNNNQITDNRIAGLRQQIFAISTQPDAIRADGDEHLIQNNIIGVDANNAEVGVCGRGIYLSGAETLNIPQVLDNVIVNPEMSAISLNGAVTKGFTVRNNIIKKGTAWPQIEGNPEAEDAIQMGPSLPDVYVEFNPAAVTEIKGTAVTGTQGANSPCPNCIIEIYRDDNDSVKETLALLAVTTANANGNWTATLSAELASGEGLRTTSTTAQFNTITGMNAGTTTQLSEWYTSSYDLYLPMTIR